MRALAWSLGVVVLLGAPAGATAGPESTLELSVLHPPTGVEMDPSEPAFLAGEAYLRLAATEGLDAVLVIDVSASTGLFGGEDLDGDRVLEHDFAGPDSVLAAELIAARRVVGELASGSPRVAVVTFAGGNGASASLAAPLTTDFHRLAGVLDALARHRPAGMTDTAAALRQAREAFPPGSRRRDRVVLLFTDGPPTHPHAGSARNLEAALEEARRCAAQGIRIHTFAIGAEALKHPDAPIRIAEATGGYFTPVAHPSELAELASRVARASIREVAVTNRSTGRSASHLRLDYDGTWSALVALRPGENVIEVVAHALGDTEARQRIVVVGRQGARTEVPEDLERHRRALLQERLSELVARTEALKDRLRRRLAAEMERRARREVELEAQRDAEAARTP